MTKTQLINNLSEKLGISKKLASEMVNAFIETVIEGVCEDGQVKIQSFGSFTRSERKARMGVNPQNPSEKIHIPASKHVSFKAGSDFKSAVKAS